MNNNINEIKKQLDLDSYRILKKTGINTDTIINMYLINKKNKIYKGKTKEFFDDINNFIKYYYYFS